METAELEEVLASVRTFVRTVVVAAEQQIEDENRIPDSIRDTAKRMGLFGFALPTAHGGLGLSMLEETRLVMELGYTTPAFRSMFGTNNGIAGHVLMLGGTLEQQRRWLPRIASGDVVASFGLTEADAGSSPADLKTAARRDGDEWVIDGAKRFITNAPLADLFLVFARTDPQATGGRGISAFLVPGDSAGLRVAAADAKMGQAGSSTADVYLDGVRVGAESVIGGEAGLGNGYFTALKCLAHGRIHIAALCVGMAERLVDESVSYAKSRRQGGQPIGSFQLVQAMIADSVTEHRAGRSLVLDVAAAYDRAESIEDTRTGPACAKYFASEMVGRVADRAVQIHGGAGYMRGVAVERFYRDARLFRLYEGTSQIQQVIIATQVLGDAARA
jgi:acyl-CoA dehydrogenase